MLSHWYNHDNLNNSIKVKNINTKIDKPNFLKVPEMGIKSNLIFSQTTDSSNLSINSNKGSSINLRDGSPNFRAPWKIVMLGDAGVGKTSIVKQYLNDEFNTLYNPTVEDSYLHHITLPDGLNQCIEILDTSGYYQFPAMRELNIRLGTAFILVFDLSQNDSLQSLENLKQNIINIKGTENIPIVVVGNKLDLIFEQNDSHVKSALKISNSYIESSAKNNINISKIFKLSVELIMKEIEEMNVILNSSNTVSRRNSSISFVRRISTSNLLNIKSEQSRRFSEPVCVDNKIQENIRKSKKCEKKVNSKENCSGKESNTPTKRKQKNCVIS